MYISLSALLRISSLLVWISVAAAAVFLSPDALPRTTYDFIIIGGGTAGSVLANRLSSFNKSIFVLVIEAGISNVGILPTEVPFLATSLVPFTPQNWNFTTVPQEGLQGRSITYPRGKLLGGSSSISTYAYASRFALLTLIQRFPGVYPSICG